MAGEAHDEDGADWASPGSALRLCAHCRHQRLRSRPVLFSPAELSSAEVLKAQLEWTQQERQRAQAEQHRLHSGGVFDYEPYNYHWCARYTPIAEVRRAGAGDNELLQELVAEGRATFNPVTAEINPVYAVCDRINPEAECEGYEPR
jgi:hypothetical protein